MWSLGFGFPVLRGLRVWLLALGTLRLFAPWGRYQWFRVWGPVVRTEHSERASLAVEGLLET